MKPTALIVDDEPFARRRLTDLIAEVPVVEVIGEADDGEAAVRAIDELEPDVVFLDIEMPQRSGLDVVAAIRHRPLIIFTTAYDRYAVLAFELAAVDYLLKPFGKDRLRVALERAMESLGRDDGQAAVERSRETVADTAIERLFVKDRGRIVPLTLGQIERFEARDDYVAAHLGSRRYLMHVRMQDLEERLDGGRFVRVHRSHMVNLDFVQAFEPYDAGRLMVIMQNGTRITASRSRSKELRALAE